jgi:hypothetical protein
MTVGGDYLPGCYRNLALIPGEGLAGYLLRVAEGNGYRGISSLLRAIHRSSNRPLADVLLSLRVDTDALCDIGRMTVGDPEHMLGLLSEALPPLPDPTEAIFFADCRIDRDALVLGAGPLCPTCLASRGYALAEWELAPVTVCSQHRKLLRDSCERCGVSLSWNRPALRFCGECGADLACQDAQDVVDEAVIALTDDFLSLAPFRLTSRSGTFRSVYWDEMFRVFKALLLSDTEWTLGRWPQHRANSASVQDRHQAIIVLARCRAGNAYDLSRLRWKPERALAPIAALPRPFAKEQLARQFLEAEAGLSRESADVISGADAIPLEPVAYEVIHPWPPALGNRDDVAALLGVSGATVHALMRNGRLVPPTSGQDGFDADAVLAADRFLKELVDLPRLTELAGVPADPRGLAAYGLLPRWNGVDLDDHRVDPNRLLEIQRLLIVQWRRAELPTEPITLGQLVNGCEQPFNALVAHVQTILTGQVKNVGWCAPFTWAQLSVQAAPTSDSAL